MQKPKTKTTDQNSKTDFNHRVYYFILGTLKFIEKIPYNHVTKTIINQLIRSLTSIGANIIEARACNSKRDFARYFDIALKSTNETKFWLCLLRDLGSVDKVKIRKILNETIEISNILAASLLTMRNKKSF